ncbi:MAG: hypothetical protein JNL25_18785 [Rhodospirillaceae bacterium]|nr:hypothetical protein [Rhodospirillaceae bacterium]
MRVRTFPPPLPGIRPAHIRNGPLGEVRRYHMRAVYWFLPWWEIVKRMLAALAWPFIAAWRAIFVFTPRCGPSIKRQYGIPYWRQVLAQIRISLTAMMLPQHYYLFELYRPEMRHRYHEYLVRNETKAGVFSILKFYDGRPHVFRNKLNFARECARAGLRHVPVLAFFKDGAAAYLAGDGLPPQDLFMKPFNGKGGRNAERWNWNGTGYIGKDGAILSPDALLARLAKMSADGKEDMIVQPALTNHPAYEGLSNGVLSTIRVLTCLNEEMKAEVITSAARVAVLPGKVVDNFHAGGVGANIDLATGLLGPGSNMGLKGESIWHYTHPRTGVPIAGFQVPFWPEVKELATTAHEKIADRIVVGWDIAVLPDGPCLVEGNGRTSVDLVQRARRGPLGETRLPELMAFHLRRMYPEWQKKRLARRARPGISIGEPAASEVAQSE